MPRETAKIPLRSLEKRYNLSYRQIIGQRPDGYIPIMDGFHEGLEYRQLVKDFIKEYLNGDINLLAKYDLRQLEGKERYADEAGHAHDVFRTELVRAITALAFKDIAPKEVLFDKKSGGLKLIPAPLLKEDLWGIQVGSRFAILSQLEYSCEPFFIVLGTRTQVKPVAKRDVASSIK